MNQHWTEAAVQAIGGFAAAVILSISTIPLNAHAYLWNDLNYPGNMDVGGKYEYNLKKLPLSGELTEKPWSETYWAANKGSLNVRWNTADRDGFSYYPPTRTELTHMSEQEIAQLSPAEKYDLYRGRYDFPLWWKVTGWRNPDAPNWYGICDGWSYAAISYSEPQPIRAKNPDGIIIPFGSSDLKGLMSFAAASDEKGNEVKITTVNSYQVGIKCNRKHGPGCDDDMNAGAMHVVMANQLGLIKQPFVTERDPQEETWNQPTFGYKSEIIGSARVRDGDHGVLVHTQLFYTDELEFSQWDPVVGTANFRFDKIDMRYTLDLDENDNIIGGTWVDGSDHPDYMWIPVAPLTFKGTFSALNELIRK